MDAVNPVYIPRNYLVEEALDAATSGDLEPFERLLAASATRSNFAPGSSAMPNRRHTRSRAYYQTFCGT